MRTHHRLHEGEELAGLDPKGPDGGDRPHGDLQLDREGLVACPADGWLRHIDTMSNDSRPTLAGVVLAAERAAMTVAEDS